MTLRERTCSAAVVLGFVAFGLWAQRALLFGLADHVYAQNLPGNDALLHVWSLAWGQHALRVQPADATITIDGEPWQGAQDQDPLEVQLAPGVHTVEIRKDGYRTYITDITVRPGDTTPLNVSLTRQ